MNNTTEKMVERIEKAIERTKEYYERRGWNETHEKHLAKINGMIEMLKIVTEKEYYFDENGLHER